MCLITNKFMQVYKTYGYLSKLMIVNYKVGKVKNKNTAMNSFTQFRSIRSYLQNLVVSHHLGKMVLCLKQNTEFNIRQKIGSIRKPPILEAVCKQNLNARNVSWKCQDMHIENKSYQADKMKRSRSKEISLLSLRTLKEETNSSELRLQ